MLAPLTSQVSQRSNWSNYQNHQKVSEVSHEKSFHKILTIHFKQFDDHYQFIQKCTCAQFAKIHSLTPKWLSFIVANLCFTRNACISYSCIQSMYFKKILASHFSHSNHLLQWSFYFYLFCHRFPSMPKCPLCRYNPLVFVNLRFAQATESNEKQHTSSGDFKVSDI